MNFNQKSLAIEALEGALQIDSTRQDIKDRIEALKSQSITNNKKQNMKYLLSLFVLLTTVNAYNQCGEFDNLLQKGDNYLKRTTPNYQEAINAYAAAMLACSGRADEAKQRITSMVNDINLLKESAVAAEKKAIEAQRQANENARTAEEAKIDAEQKAEKARIAEQEADSLRIIAEERFKIAEASKLAFLANAERESGNTDDAFALGFQGISTGTRCPNSIRETSFWQCSRA